jgi:hypothetical protein
VPQFQNLKQWQTKTYQIVGLLGRVVAQLAGLFVSGALHELAKLVHEVPGHVVAVLALGERQVADGARRPDVDLLGLVHHDLSLLGHQIVVLNEIKFFNKI